MTDCAKCGHSKHDLACGVQVPRSQATAAMSYDGPWFCGCRSYVAALSRDGLLYEIRRSLEATHPDRAEALCAALERLMTKPCERCGADDATYEANPYAAEIHGDHSPCWMCDSCRMESASDI